jgi:hypothetical protein
MTQRHLRLVVSNPEIMMSMPIETAGSAHRLAAQVVNMARTWAAEQDCIGFIPEIGTSVGLAQRALMDAVHDLEYFESGTAHQRYGRPPI